MQTLFDDLRYALRILLRAPGFAVIAILALALGIGANTAIFSAVDAILLRPLPYGDPDQLVMLWGDASFVSFPRNNLSPADYVDWRKQNQVFTDVAALRNRSASLTGAGTPEMVIGRQVTANLFDVLGVKPMLGRTFSEEEDRTNASVVVIGYGMWQRRYGGDRALVGQPIDMNGEKVVVTGIMPRGFSFPDKAVDFWLPMNFSPKDLANRGSHFLTVVARMKPGITLPRAEAEMAGIAKHLAQAYPETNSRLGAVVVPLREQVVGDTRIALIVLLGAAGCVLLIACANIANLLLARASTRQREMAIRTALGADRSRLVRQMVTESLLLSVSGGALGLGLAKLSMRTLERFIPAGMASSTGLSMDARVLLFTLGLAILTGVVFGLAPALQAAGINLSEGLNQGGRSGIGGRGKLLRHTLVVSEVALALVLLVGAGLMIQTLLKLRAVDPGFDAANILTMRTNLFAARYRDDAQARAYYASIAERIQVLPGVQSVGFSSNLPFTSRGNTYGFEVEGRPEPPGLATDALYRQVTADYLRTMQVRLREGRLIGREDREDSLRVVVINETFANRYWPNASPLGKRLKTSAGPELLTIVGVVYDIRERGLELEMKPGMYVPVTQVTRPDASYLAVRTAGDPLALVNAVRQAIWAVNPEQPIYGIRTMDELAETEVASRNQQMQLLGAFAALALLLASIGIYGVLSYSVTQRTREIGLRMALGATGGDMMRMIVGHGLGLTMAGLAAGAAGAFLLTKAMAKLLYGIAPADPGTYAGVALLLTAVAAMACYIPARRASRVDPMVALRDE
ncbi:MAG: ABC transporter permease [Bryobacteraceae bacterium]